MGVRLDHGDDDLNETARDQRHAVHRRDAGAADHLHDRGAAGDRRHRGRSAGRQCRAQPRPDKPLFLTLKADLSLALGNDAVARGALGAALDAATGGDKQQRVFLRADKAVPYGDLMALMNELRSAGYLHVALVGLEAPTKRRAPMRRAVLGHAGALGGLFYAGARPPCRRRRRAAGALARQRRSRWPMRR